MKRFILLVLACGSIRDRLRPRRLATNALITPYQSANGTGSYQADAAIAFENAVVKAGSDDHHIAVAGTQAAIPLGVLLHDLVSSGDVGFVQKVVALFGIYKETLPCVASAAIAQGALVVVDPANPGQVITLPGASGTYIIIGRSRFTVTTALDTVSLIHCLPYALTQ